MITYSSRINGIEAEAYYTEHSVNEIFIPFLEHLSEMQKTKDGRLFVMLSAPPGAGKSTLLSFLRQLSESHPEFSTPQIIGMDGFHRRQEYLLSHFAERDGRKIPMVNIKGAPVTFDLERLKAGIIRIADGMVCPWPVYDRMLHNPVENAVTVCGSIVILEGNYLLLDEEGWSELSAYADYTVSIRAEEALLRTRLIERRIRTGVEADAAVRFVDFSDMPNVRLCLDRTKPADLQLLLDSEGEYHVEYRDITKGEGRKENESISDASGRVY